MYRVHLLPATLLRQLGPTAVCKRGQFAATIAPMRNSHKTGELISRPEEPFPPGTMVVVTLGNPREKFWGAVLALTAEGLSLCGIELASFEDLLSMVKQGEPFSPGVVFFPMHRMERMELDLADGNIPSLSQRFTTKTGLAPSAVLTRHTPAHCHAPEEPK